MRHHCFNMVEVLLALGVVAIGVVSVLALFPAGVNSTRDAMAETYAASAAEQLLHSVRYTIEQSGSEWKAWITDRELAWQAKPAAGDLALDPSLVGAGAFGGSTQGAIHQQTAFSVYKLVAFRDKDDGKDYDGLPDEPPDFQCVAAVWGEQIETIPFQFGTRINVEVSWPGELDYPARFKRVYSLEVFNAAKD